MVDPLASSRFQGLRNYGDVPEVMPDSVGGTNFEPVMQPEKDRSCPTTEIIMILALMSLGKKIVMEIHAAA
jgi:hypothetical protein